MPAPRAPTYSSKIPGAPKGLPAIEETIFAGVPVNVTLLFSREQYLSAAEAYLRGIERRIAAGLKPDVRTHAALTPSQVRPLAHRTDAVTAEQPQLVQRGCCAGGASAVTTVKSVAAVVRVEVVEAGCVTTSVVPAPTTVATLRRKSGGTSNTDSN